MEFILANWEIVLLVLLIADKIVAATPNKYDDIFVTAVKSALKAVFPGKPTSRLP